MIGLVKKRYQGWYYVNWYYVNGKGEILSHWSSAMETIIYVTIAFRGSAC